MKEEQRLKLERLYNMVQPSRLVLGLKSDDNYKPIGIFEEVVKATDDEAGLRVQAASWYLNDMRKPALHPDNDKQYHFACLVVEAINSLPDMLSSLAPKE